MNSTLPSERHYAVLQLEESMAHMKQACTNLPVLRQRVAKYQTSHPSKAKEAYDLLRKQHHALTDVLRQCRLSLLEMELLDHAAYAAQFTAAVEAFPLMTPDYTKFARALLTFAEKLPAQTTNAAVVGRLMNSIKQGYYPTDLDHIRQIVRGIAFPDGVTTNVFDPCCGCGLALRTLAQGNNCYTYGIELDQSRAEEAQTRLHRVGFGKNGQTGRSWLHGFRKTLYARKISRSLRRYHQDAIRFLARRFLYPYSKARSLTRRNWPINLKMQRVFRRFLPRASWIAGTNSLCCLSEWDKSA